MPSVSSRGSRPHSFPHRGWPPAAQVSPSLAMIASMLVERYPELEAALEWVHSDDEREATRTRTLAGRDGGDLWVFAYGSLIRYIAHGSGFLGTSHSYLANIVSQLNVLNIHDPDCVRLLKEVDEFLGARESGRPGEADQ